MNKYFLWAVAIAALCSACETDNEAFAPETKKQTIALQQAKSAEANDYQMYQSILSSFVYNQDETYAENLLRFEQHVNQYIPHSDETTPYKPLDLKQIAFLTTADAGYIEHFNYSATAKTMMYAVLNQRYNDETAKSTLEPQEYRLVQTLAALYNDNNGNGYDDDIRGRRTIAFAYGAQYSFTQAVLYAGQ
ncbi:hypothetical protein SAMN02927937_01593 [Paenimyroides aquimaris]|uniref:Uncharacterized protein n=1 Tax=Paenimyroides marinum TaxID=1159016 RepID=A0A1H6LBZ7_9FLAO|nr:hypothetical protein [Paenimyroides aquimaris]SEH81850.1 hypothetical protein SAMN02927937_01593 [Paenimyroides aquimaris]